MRISDRYITRQVIVVTLYAIVVLSLVLVMGNLFKQIRPLLVEQGAPIGLVLRFVVNVIPYSLMFTIPWGFLSAVLIVFGRMSGEHEVTGFRVAGISLARLSLPVFVVGAALSGICVWINVNVVPQATASLEDLIYEQVKRDPRSLLDPGIVQSRFENQKVFVEQREGDALNGFHLYQVSGVDDGRQARVEAYVHAGKVSLVVDEGKKQLRLKLLDAFIETKQEDGTSEFAFAGEAEPWLFDFGSTRNRKLNASTMTNGQIRSYLDENPELPIEMRVEFRSEIVQRYTFSMACLAFASVAVPLGIKGRRKDTSSGLILSIVIGMAYFLSSVVTKHIDSEFLASLALWGPNVFCGLLGFQLFRRARFR